METRPIPGYYFDKEKNKYFKVQPSGTAPADAAYSSFDVKRRKLRDVRIDARELAAAREQGRIKRSKLLAEPLYGGILAREKGQIKLDTTQILARGFVPQGRWITPGGVRQCSSPVFEVVHTPNLSPSMSDIYIGYDDQLLSCSISSEKRDARYDIYSGYDAPSHRQTIERFGHSGDSTSICVSEDNGRVAMTWLSYSSQTGIAVVPLRTSLDSDSQPAVTFGAGTDRGSDVDIFSSTAAPAASSLMFAFGTSRGVLEIDKDRNDMSWCTPFCNSAPLSQREDIFALEFLQDSPDVLLSGGRPGILAIRDLRESLYDETLRRTSITHPSTITHIKQINSRHVLVAGLNSTLCQYDLRLLRQGKWWEAPASPLYTPLARGIRRNDKPTSPVLDYPGYQNSATIQIGFDVDLESGIIAAAQEPDDHHPPVQLFSLHGGNKVHGLSLLPSGHAKMGAKVKCVRFARDTEGSMKSLYVGDYASNDILRFAWADLEDEEIVGWDLEKIHDDE